MPVALEPQEKRMFWLKSDAEKPRATRPMFACAAPSSRLRRRIEAIRAELVAMPKDGDDAFFDKMVEGIGLGVTGWVNFGDKAFDPATLRDVLDDYELGELWRGWPTAYQLNEDEEKKSSSPFTSAAESSAGTAAAESASTIPPMANP